MSENITTAMVMQLRKRTGVGISKCKEALVLAEGNIDEAIDILRKKGMAQAVKKEGRETKEGLVGIGKSEKYLSIIEVNAETDFVIKNDKFISFVKDLAAQAAKTTPNNLEDFLAQKYEKDTSTTIDEARTLLIQKIGENIQLRRLEIIHRETNASYGLYLHLGGKIGTIVEITGSADVSDVAKDIAMHVAAEDPEYIKESEVPLDAKKREEEVFRSQVTGKKPENILDKIIDGKMRSFYTRVCLSNQPFVKDSSVSVLQYLEAKGKEIGKPLSIQRFWRWQIGS
jgi:elongation factor Ts